MTMRDVVKVAEAFNVSPIPGPLGVVVGWPGLEQARLETTRGDDWRLVERSPRDGTFRTVHTSHIRLPEQLRRALREWLAGPRPIHIPAGYEAYARSNVGDHVWVMRRKR